MPGIGKNSTQINVTVPADSKAVVTEMRKRAESLRWSTSAYGLEIWKWWHAQGGPAVSAQDQAMLLAAKISKAKG